MSEMTALTLMDSRLSQGIPGTAHWARRMLLWILSGLQSRARMPAHTHWPGTGHMFPPMQPAQRPIHRFMSKCAHRGHICSVASIHSL